MWEGRESEMSVLFDYEELTCGECGICFGVPSRLAKVKRDNAGSLWCPNGHSLIFKKSRADELAEELSRVRQRLAEKEDDLRYQGGVREAAERSASAMRGQVTKLKKRVAAGVCPCCNRTFSALADHMAKQHPEFRSDDAQHENIISLVKARG
jgi:hypothetical protein